MSPTRGIQIGVSAVVLGAAAAHLIWPTVAIDVVTLTLLIAAIVPWLLPLFKSLEFPGGWKVEFQERLEAAAARAEEAGLLSKEIEQPKPSYSFELVENEDPVLALAGLRIEIEKRLTELTELTGGAPRFRGMGGLLRHLGQKDVFSREEQSVLADLTGLLNSAVHGARVPEQSAAWALQVGRELLAQLDRRIARRRVDAGS
jgi:hypothetical protein